MFETLRSILSRSFWKVLQEGMMYFGSEELEAHGAICLFVSFALQVIVSTKVRDMPVSGLGALFATGSQVFWPQ